MNPHYLRFRSEFITLCPERYPADYIDGQIEDGYWRCFGNADAAILAEIKTYPSGLKEVHGLAAAGKLLAILDLIPLAEQWGRDEGCAIASIESREGWKRLLPDYQIEQVRIVKELS